MGSRCSPELDDGAGGFVSVDCCKSDRREILEIWVFDGYEEIEEKERKPKMGLHVRFVRFPNANTDAEPNSATTTSQPSRTLGLPKFRLKSVRIGSKTGRFGGIG